jgi:hypothetical protein
VERRNPGRGDGGGARLATLGDLAGGTGGVVGGVHRPRAGAQELIGLPQRRGDRVHGRDRVEPLARQRQQR